MNKDIEKTIEWMQNTYAAIEAASGNPTGVISSIPVDVLIIFIRNNLHLQFKAPTND